MSPISSVIADRSTARINSSKRSRLGFKLAVAIINLGCCLGIPALPASKAISAENIYLDYGPLEFSLSVKSLEIYAKEGKIESDFNTFAGYLQPAQLEQLKTALSTKADLSPLAIAQFLYSYQGEKILERIGRVIKTSARQPGFYALRSALILAAADEREGLTLLNVLKKYPTQGIRIDSNQGFAIVGSISEIIQKSERAFAAVEREASAERNENLAASNLLPISSNDFSYRQQLLTLRDRQRKRTFPVDLYLPQTEGKTPLIVISHGLGSDRTTFAYLAKYLAARGFAVAVPEHPGSNSSQIQDLLEGFANDVTPPRELVDRPLDIKFLLDELEANYSQQLNTQQVGIIGQSFGAYTALALAGAELNFDNLRSECSNLEDTFNISLLLQCLALELPRREYQLRDRRIVAAIAINPLVSAVFGQAGMSEIEIPVMLMSGSADPVTPALAEQIMPFTWLTTEQKYLALLKGGTHFSVLNESSGSIPVPQRAIGPSPRIAQNYLKQLSLAFFKTYISERQDFRAYLSANYAARISRQEFPISLVRSLNREKLEAAP
ncbi:alpha/beta hydrolase [Myxosarcina sp. GI1]|uniref:alpha/beta hydrolase n=1 Tax=Myxosarcina sp. GI1 TaxID=1541065 RepID=UPI0009DFFA84|nr:alpha/beta hydrolase [Myxosarcina sp. GI1]